jgi:CheY-like chemotaxis protein
LEETLLPVSQYGLHEYLRPVSPLRPLILYLERDAKVLDIRKAVLEREGYSVIGVSQREEALKTLRDYPVSLTITDHLLSSNQPSELAREMKKIKPDVPIILFSSTVPQHFDGVDVYVNKREPTTEFLRIVRHVVE